MQDAGVLSRAIGRIYETLLDDGAESGWLDLVRDTVGAEHAMLSDAGEANVTTHASRIEEGLLPLARHLASTTMHDPALARMPPRSACRLSDHFPVRDLMRTEFYQQFVRPLHGGYALAYTWQHAGGRTAIAVCRDAARRRDYADHEVAVLQPLLSHLHNAFDLRTRVLGGQAALRQAHATLDAVRDGVMIVDRACRVQFVNAAAAALLRDGSALRIDRQVLHAANGRDDRRLRALVDDMLAITRAALDPGAERTSEWPRTGGMLAIARTPPRRPVLVSALPVDTTMRMSGSWTLADTVTLLLRDPGQTRTPCAAALMDAFGLTPRESQLALALGDGAALSHAARRLGITEGTARQYLKSVFAKTGVRRQSELVALLSSLV